MRTVDRRGLTERAVEIYQKQGPSEVAKKGNRFVKRKVTQQILNLGPINDISLSQSLKRIHSQNRSIGTDEEVIEAAFSFEGVGNYQTIEPMQNEQELVALVNHLQKVKPEVIMEIGSRFGGTFYTLVRSLESVNCALSVDIGMTKEKAILFKNFDTGTDIKCLAGNSQTKKMREKVQEVLPRNPDFILIDGDHRYDGVKRDWDLYKEIISEDGVIAFHDISSTNKLNGVPKLWDEISENRETTELVTESKNRRLKDGGGIGLVEFGR